MRSHNNDIHHLCEEPQKPDKKNSLFHNQNQHQHVQVKFLKAVSQKKSN